MTRVWVLTSGRTGDDKQSLRLGQALADRHGIEFEEKKIVFNDRATPWRVTFGPSLVGVDGKTSDPLGTPWPEVVISSGWRQVPVVRWIKRQSGGRTQLVQMNRPPGPKHFDLVLSPPQYSIPTRANIIPLDWPLQLPPTQDALDQARREWKGRLDPYPRPWTVALVGGASYPFSMNAETAARLFEQALERAKNQGGSLMISTSRRTPKPALDILRGAARAASERILFYEWKPEATDNPYIALLADGDEFAITPDSISMLVEVARLGRPVAIAPHTRYRTISKELRNSAKRVFHGQVGQPPSALREFVSDLASLFGLKYVRDLGSVSERMIERGWAAHFPAFRGGLGEPLPDEDFDRLVERVRGFVTDPGS
jgi:mitochondrial fission protein ELM1